MCEKQSLQPVSREVTDKYLQRTTQFFWINEEVQPNFYEAIFRMCENPKLLRTASSRYLGLKENRLSRFCACRTDDGARNLNVYYIFFNIKTGNSQVDRYLENKKRYHSVRGLAKFIALLILLSENHIQDFPF